MRRKRGVVSERNVGVACVPVSENTILGYPTLGYPTLENPTQ